MLFVIYSRIQALYLVLMYTCDLCYCNFFNLTSRPQRPPALRLLKEMGWCEEVELQPLTDEEVLSARLQIEKSNIRNRTPPALSPFPWVFQTPELSLQFMLF